MENLLTWTIYEITTDTTPIHGVMLRGRLRKLSLENDFLLLTENASDKENCVRFALADINNLAVTTDYLNRVIPDAQITEVKSEVQNPVLSKLKVNIESRYNLKT